MSGVTPTCFWCDDTIEFSAALINPVNGKVQCRDCRDLDIMRQFTESVAGAVKKLRAELLAARIKDISADMDDVIKLHEEMQ